MKAFFKWTAYIVGALIALAWLNSMSAIERWPVILLASGGYAFWALQQAIHKGNERNAATLERLEQELHRQQHIGLTSYEQDGLAEMISDHRKIKSLADGA